jgi:hypothetical protein
MSNAALYAFELSAVSSQLSAKSSMFESMARRAKLRFPDG